MGVNLSTLRKKKDEAIAKFGANAEYWQIPVGQNLIYVGPPIPGDDLPFAEVAMHFRVGPDSKMVTCLDKELNPILNNERIIKILEKRKKDISDGCDVCGRLDEGSKVGDEVKNRYFFPIVPLKFRKSTNKKWREADDADELRILACGYTVWSGITDIMINNGDITDPNQAILVCLERNGTGLNSKYTVQADSDSVREGGIKLSKQVRALVKKVVQEGEIGDLYRLIGNSIKSSAEVRAIVEGVPLEDVDNEDSDRDTKPDCFGLDFEDDDDDCDDCSYRDECSKKCTPPGSAPSDDSEDDDEIDEEEASNELKASECISGQWYAEPVDSGDEIIPMKFVGTSKKGKETWAFFELDDGDRLRLNGSDTVVASYEPSNSSCDISDEADDDDMKALDEAIEKRKKAKEAKAAKGKAKGKSKK